MATAINTYQCPACTGPVHFSPETGKVVCDYCGSTYELKEIEALYAEKDAKAAQAQAEAEAQAQAEAEAEAQAQEQEQFMRGMGIWQRFMQRIAQRQSQGYHHTR